MMDGMGGNAGAMKGLTSAAPAQTMEAPTASPEDAMALLQDAVAQYGPEIIEILRQILSQGGAGDAGMMGMPQV